mmetsp:Transcript_6446/g.19049  ORF Transcript_6446/g.19049 Transcript_6446/m.19049 type:complete len:244 (-) Transcript_6446:1596-2327(-)
MSVINVVALVAAVVDELHSTFSSFELWPLSFEVSVTVSSVTVGSDFVVALLHGTSGATEDSVVWPSNWFVFVSDEAGLVSSFVLAAVFFSPADGLESHIVADLRSTKSSTRHDRSCSTEAVDVVDEYDDDDEGVGDVKASDAGLDWSDDSVAPSTVTAVVVVIVVDAAAVPAAVVVCGVASIITLSSLVCSFSDLVTSTHNGGVNSTETFASFASFACAFASTGSFFDDFLKSSGLRCPFSRS